VICLAEVVEGPVVLHVCDTVHGLGVRAHTRRREHSLAETKRQKIHNFNFQIRERLLQSRTERTLHTFVPTQYGMLRLSVIRTLLLFKCSVSTLLH
jgi:hypothetical protein